jgi:hypothetical protein
LTRRRQEIAHAIAHYDEEREGLGAEFWEELSSALQTLEAPGPECGSVIGLPRELGVRRKLLLRFPYAIVFVEGETFVRVMQIHVRNRAAPPVPRFEIPLRCVWPPSADHTLALGDIEA